MITDKFWPEDVRAAIHEVCGPLIEAAMRRGPIPSFCWSEWEQADDAQRLARILITAEAWAVFRPDLEAMDRMKAAAEEVRNGRRTWSGHVSYVELQRRRGEAA